MTDKIISVSVQNIAVIHKQITILKRDVQNDTQYGNPA
jgi:hypothetical protein